MLDGNINNIFEALAIGDFDLLARVLATSEAIEGAPRRPLGRPKWCSARRNRPRRQMCVSCPGSPCRRPASRPSRDPGRGGRPRTRATIRSRSSGRRASRPTRRSRLVLYRAGPLRVESLNACQGAGSTPVDSPRTGSNCSRVRCTPTGRPLATESGGRPHSRSSSSNPARPPQSSSLQVAQLRWPSQPSRRPIANPCWDLHFPTLVTTWHC
mmetsp:Transcript_129826/g.416603  ORF Transcript_129826/g.416603 Transcript_129826/m.416603 type:complete len:212 (+) Transcript_129826:246-881(+)